jgi:glycosyltransferase involved in cell wall biosynthesis
VNVVRSTWFAIGLKVAKRNFRLARSRAGGAAFHLSNVIVQSANHVNATDQAIAAPTGRSRHSAATEPDLRAPAVSVVMSLYRGNTLSEVVEAVESILNQTIADLEFLILCDGPLSEDLHHYLQTLAAAEPRVRLHACQENRGIARSLNELLRAARADYIAIMDGDDISLPQRLERQRQFLEEHPAIDIVGTFAQEIDEHGNTLFDKRMPTDSSVIARFLAYRDPLVHPSVMYRKCVFETLGYYDESKNNAFLNDTEFWSRALLAGRKISNLPETLYLFRRNKDFLHRRRGWQLALAEFKLRTNYIKRSGLPKHHLLRPTAVALIRLLPSKLLRWFYQHCR